MKFNVPSIAALALISASTSLLAQQGWTVKPEWVSAHESFLSSDVLAGRGSATRDEELTATYVASEFESYGLKPAPGMTAYLQSAEIVSPELDGHATLQTGKVSLKEDGDFVLLISNDDSVAGPLVRIAAADVQTAKIDEGSAILLTGATDPQTLFSAMSALRHRGAVAILVPETTSLASIPQMFGGKTRVNVRLADDPPRKTPTVILIHAEAAARFTAKDGTPISITVHALPPTKPRQTFNAIGYLAGTDPAAGTLLLTAHLDHLGAGRPVNGDAPIYNGANDDAAGTTAVLELAHALGSGSPRLRRNVLFVECYGSEEMWRGWARPTLKNILLSRSHRPCSQPRVRNDRQPGSEDAPRSTALHGMGEIESWSGPSRNMAHCWGPIRTPNSTSLNGQITTRSLCRSVVAHTAAGWGTVPTYHQPNDDMAHLDLPFMTRAIQSLIEPVRWLANSDFRPQWNPGGAPKRSN